MTCQRCQGPMVDHWFHGTENATFNQPPAFRCVICGEIIDDVILTNRQIQAVFHEMGK